MTSGFIPKELETVSMDEIWTEYPSMKVYFSPPAGQRNGRWLTFGEMAEIIDRHGPSYVRHFQPEWARGGEARLVCPWPIVRIPEEVWDEIERATMALGTALGDRDRWDLEAARKEQWNLQRAVELVASLVMEIYE